MADVNGGGGAQAVGAATGQNVSGGLYNTGTGQTTGQGNTTFGQLQSGGAPEYLFNAAQQDPGVAAHLLRLAHGQTGPVTSRLGQFGDNLYGKMLQAYLALGGVGGVPSGFGAMQGFLSAQNSGGLEGLLNSTASQAAGADFTGQLDPDIEKILRAAIALRSVNIGSLGGSLMSNDLDNVLYQHEGAGLQEGPYGPSASGGLARSLRSDQFGQALRSYLGAQ